MEVIGLGRGQDFHLLGDPVAAVALFQVRIECGEDVAQMRHVGNRVVHLLVRQRAMRPVRKTMRLVRTMPGDALDQLVISDAVAIAEDHRRDLRVEDRLRDDAGPVPDDLDVLPGGVKDLQHVRVRHQREEGREVDAVGERIDDDSLVGAGHLNNAEQGVIGGLAQEFGIDGDDPVFGQAVTGGGELVSGRNQVHERSIRF